MSQATTWLKDGWYWLNDARDGWLAVQFDEQAGDTVTLKTAEGEAYDMPTSTVLRPALASSLRPHSNLLELEELHEGAILHALRTRYGQDEIYTSISEIVISINPYKQLPIYGPNQIAKYRRGLRSGQEAGATTTTGAATQLAPHVYAVADAAYTSMLRDESNQAILISGESGAGKTEATKLVLQYLAESQGASSGGSIGAVGDGVGDEEKIAQQILESNPILEAFGNSRTIRNNNSSRFGKLIEIHFEEAGSVGGGPPRICGAKIYSYLLEKSRVVNHAVGERNYHSMYQLCAGATNEERKLFHLPANGAAGFRILTRGGCLEAEGQDDKADWAELKNALSVLNFADEEAQTLMKVLAAILHVGNIEFDADPTDAKRMRVSNPEQSLALACQLLQLDPAVCASALLQRQLRIAGGENITVFNTSTACSDNRDTLAKGLYESLFLYLIHRINATLGSASPARPRVIGVLDIFGFENFEQTGNFFEQLCINYANEKLNEHFTEHIFRLESQIYAQEAIDVSAIAYVDHALCLALIEERRTGILDMVTEELRLPKGSDENLLQRMHDAYGGGGGGTLGGSSVKSPTSASASSTSSVNPLSAYYLKPKTREAIFGIRHYAGDVWYRVELFLEKSKDSLPEALLHCVESSSEPLVARLLDKSQYMTGSAAAGAPASLTSPTAAASSPSSAAFGSPLANRSKVASLALSPSPSPLSPTNGLPKAFGSPMAGGGGTLGGGGGGTAAALTLGAQFRSQLSDLLGTLNSCRANFLRCLKPNSSKLADYFDSVFVLRQLQYLGIKEVIAIRQQGFPVRMKYEEFLKRYGPAMGEKQQQSEMKQVLLAIHAAQHAPPPAGADAGAPPAASLPASLVAQCTSLAQSLLTALDPGHRDFRLGRTQAFFRSDLQKRLEGEREKFFHRKVIQLQACWRGVRARRRVHKMRLVYRELHQQQEQGRTRGLGGKDGLQLASELPAFLAAFDATIESASELMVPARFLTAAKAVRLQVHESLHCRRALESARASKDAAALRKALDHAKELGLPEDTLEVSQATVLLARLIAYAAALATAIAERSIDLLAAALAEAAALGLDAQSERDAHTLLAKLRVEAQLTSELASLLSARGPLAALKEVLSRADQAGMSSDKGGEDVVSRAHALAALLTKEETLLAALAAAVQARLLAPLERVLHDILDDPALIGLHAHQLVDQAKLLQAQLLSAAMASDRASNLRGAFASRNISLIENNLHQLRALGSEALASLGSEGATVQTEAETLLVSLRSRATAIVALSSALASRSLADLEDALRESTSRGAQDSSEHEQAVELFEALKSTGLALDRAATEEDLALVEAALARAARFGIPSQSQRVQLALARRDVLVRDQQVLATIHSAVSARDERQLAHAISVAREADWADEDPRLNSAKSTLAAIVKVREDDAAERARVAQEEAAERLRVAEALEQEQERVRKEAEEEAAARAAEREAAAAPRPAGPHQAHPPHADGSGHAPSSSSGRRVFHADTYRQRHFTLALFPLLRSPDDFSKGKVFNRQTVKASMLSWSKEALPRSLSTLGTPSMTSSQLDDLNSEALTMWKSIQGFMGDRVYSFPDAVGCEVLGKALMQPALRDEVYLQLAKQLSHNTSVESVRKGWQLLAMATDTFAPSPALKPFLYNFLLGYHDVTQFHCRSHVSFALRMLQQDPPAKVTPPTIDYVTAFRERVMTSADVVIYLPDGSSVSLGIDATMTCGQCVAQLSEMLGIPAAASRLPSSSSSATAAAPVKPLSAFGLFHTSKSTEPVFITPSECLLDYPASKASAAALASAASPSQLIDGDVDATGSSIGASSLAGGGVGLTYRFIFQRRIWPLEWTGAEGFGASLQATSKTAMDQLAYTDLTTSDQLVCSIMYHQLLCDLFLHSHYDVERAELVAFTAQHQRLVESGTMVRIGTDDTPIVHQIAQMLPTCLAQWPADEVVAFKNDVTTAATQLTTPESYSPLNLLRAFATRPHLGFQAYLVSNTEVKVLPASLWIGVSLHGVFLIDHTTRHVLKCWRFAHLAGWAANAAKFSVRVLIGRGKTQQLNFACKTGKRIVATLQEFVDILVAQQQQQQPQPSPPAAQ